MEPAVARMGRRIVAEHVIAAVGVDDPIEGRRHVVGVQRREPARLLGQLPQRVLRRPELLHQFVLHAEDAARGPGDAAAGRVRARHHNHGTRTTGPIGDPGALHEVRGHPRQAARIDRVEIHVGARRHGDGVLTRANDRRRIVRAEHVANRVVEPFAEEEQGLAPASDAAQKLGRVLQRVEHAERAGSPLELCGVRHTAVACLILRIDFPVLGSALFCEV